MDLMLEASNTKKCRLLPDQRNTLKSDKVTIVMVAVVNSGQSKMDRKMNLM